MENENNMGWLDVTAAAALVGRSVSTIRRILPDIPETAIKREPLAGQGGYKVLVDRKWLLDHFGQKEVYHAIQETPGTLSAIEKQLEQKDKQIEHLQRDGEAKTRQLETAHQQITELTSNVQQLVAFNAGLQNKMLQLAERVGDRAERPAATTDGATQRPAYWVAVAVLLSLIAGLLVYLLVQWLGNG